MSPADTAKPPGRLPGKPPRRLPGKPPRRLPGKSRRRLPGDPTAEEMVERIIRVDQAGEYGAVRIYDGQLAVLGKTKMGPVIRKMAAAERHHLDTFNDLVAERRVRPTALMPLWHLAGFALGAGTALLGEKAAMACTVAVEEVIDEHYAGQLDHLDEDQEAELRKTVIEFRDDELEHRDEGLAHGAREAPGYEGLSTVVKAGSRLAIWLSERI
jgi:3-demethoxyubiquinol 3-hydroxylase